MASRLTPGRRTHRPAPKYETSTHSRATGLQRTYTVTTDQWGGYTISLGGKLLRTQGGLHGFGTHYGSKKLREDGLRSAIATIETLSGMDEE